MFCWWTCAEWLGLLMCSRCQKNITTWLSLISYVQIFLFQKSLLCPYNHFLKHKGCQLLSWRPTFNQVNEGIVFRNKEQLFLSGLVNTPFVFPILVFLLILIAFWYHQQHCGNIASACVKKPKLTRSQHLSMVFLWGQVHCTAD